MPLLACSNRKINSFNREVIREVQPFANLQSCLCGFFAFPSACCFQQENIFVSGVHWIRETGLARSPSPKVGHSTRSKSMHEGAWQAPDENSEHLTNGPKINLEQSEVGLKSGFEFFHFIRR
jgi:hypothetical protein